jgi:hypothetical protein
MATNKSKSKPVKKAEWKGYIKINLTAEQDAAFDDWVKTSGVGLSWAEAIVDDGYKLSFTHDSYHSGISAAMYCTDAKEEWAGYSLTAWGGDLYEAFNMLCYKHFVISNQQWELPPDLPEKAYKRRG